MVIYNPLPSFYILSHYMNAKLFHQIHMYIKTTCKVTRLIIHVVF